MNDLRAKLPDGYSIEVGGIVEDSARAQASVAAVVPVMLIIMLVLLMMQLQSFQRVLLVIGVARRPATNSSGLSPRCSRPGRRWGSLQLWA